MSKFSLCTIRDQVGAGIAESIRERRIAEQFLDRKRLHINMIVREGRAYEMNRETSMCSLSTHCSVIIGGANQSEFGFPVLVQLLETFVDTR